MKYLLKLILISLSFEVFSNDLLSIYKEALDKDPEFNSKKADLAISKESLNQSRSGLLPQVRVTGGTNWNEYYQDKELQNDYNTFSYGLNISQPLFRLDKWFLNKQAKENLEAAEAQFAYQQQELIIKVTRAYFKVLSARANLEAKVATEKALRNQYDSVLERFNTGSVSRIELAEAKAALNRAESDRVQAEGNVDISFEELNSIVGRQVKLITPLNTSLDYIAPRTDVENEVSKGLTNNYLIIEAKNRLEAADANTKSKSSNYLPKIDLNANANRRTSKQYTFDGVDSNIDLPFTIPTETENRIYSIQFSMPLFTSGLIIHREDRHFYRKLNQKNSSFLLKGE